MGRRRRASQRAGLTERGGGVGLGQPCGPPATGAGGGRRHRGRPGGKRRRRVGGAASGAAWRTHPLFGAHRRNLRPLLAGDDCALSIVRTVAGERRRRPANVRRPPALRAFLALRRLARGGDRGDRPRQEPRRFDCGPLSRHAAQLSRHAHGVGGPGSGPSLRRAAQGAGSGEDAAGKPPFDAILSAAGAIIPGRTGSLATLGLGIVLRQFGVKIVQRRL